jgi:hypothetical protein
MPDLSRWARPFDDQCDCIISLWRARQVQTKIAREFTPKSSATSSPRPPAIAQHERILYVWVLQLALRYELEQTSKSEILRKLKQRFDRKTIQDVRFRVG